MSATALSASLIAGWGTVANAQSAPAAQADSASTVNEVVVTGSRIRTSPLSKTQAVVEVDQAAILKTGLSSTADVLQRLPFSGGGLNTRFNNSGNFGNPPDGGGVGAGAAEIDLRYLGSRRVLVLVDGLRWVSGASASGVPGAVDLNTIPEGMIDRIEVLQEGASPVYGSDAIAGVVNIITKKRQHGLQASAEAGQYGQGDGLTRQYTASWGASEGRTSIVIGGGYVKQDPVMSGDRAISKYPRPYATSCLAGGCSSGTPLGRFIVHDPNTNQDLDMTLKQALAPGVVPTYTPADPTGAGSSFKDFTNADRFNFQPYNYIVTPSERMSGFGEVTHDFTDTISLRVRGSYVERKSANQAAPLPLFVGPDAGNGNLLDTVAIDATNPYNPFGFTLQPGTYSFVGRRLVEAGPRHYSQDVNTWNVSATLSGQLAVMGRTFYWDANAVWSRNHADQIFTGNVNAARVQQALGPLSGCTGDCVPLNLFGGAGSITPAMLKYIGFTQQDSSEQELHDYTLNLTGDLINLPAGPLGFATGYEHRENSGYFQPDPIVAEGLSSDIPAQPAAGKISVNEVYGELRAPILADQPLFQRLEISVAGRWFDYSTSGSDSAYKGGVLWKPIKDVLIRASWGQGFRAPSIGELYGTASRFDQNINDPCSDMLGLHGGPAAAAGVQANCIAHGVPANGSYVQLNPQLPVTTSGNRQLKPETSLSRTYSLAWEPSALRGTSWSSDGSIEVVYSDITLDHAVQAQDGQVLMDRCADSNDALSCSTITRTASGAVSAISNPLINIGGVETRALDLNLLYATPSWNVGRFTLRSNTTFLLEYTEKVPTSSGLAPLPRLGTERGTPPQGWPRTRWTLSADWTKGELGASLTSRYVSSITELGGNRLGDRTYLDAQLRWNPGFLNSRFQFAVGANNVLDNDPPGCATCGVNNYDPNLYDTPGRYYYLRLIYKD
jgi:iron complex outermembrane receptor protein